jgi:hypothetical protein
MSAGTIEPDAAILAAWDRRKAAYAAFAEAPNMSSAKERALFDTIDAAEMVIMTETATTVGGAEAQAWCGLYHSLSVGGDATAAANADLDRFDANDAQLDWNVRLQLAVIRSLREQGK